VQLLLVLHLVQPLGVALPEVEHLDVRLVHGLDVAGLGVDAERDGAVDAGDFDAVAWLDGVDQVVSDVQGDGAWRLASWHLVFASANVRVPGFNAETTKTRT